MVVRVQTLLTGLHATVLRGLEDQHVGKVSEKNC